MERHPLRVLSGRPTGADNVADDDSGAAKLEWHKHKVPNTAYIVSGELTLEEKDTGRKATYHAGQSFAESVGNVHRGSAGNEPVVVIVTYAGVVGLPLSIPVSS